MLVLALDVGKRWEDVTERWSVCARLFFDDVFVDDVLSPPDDLEEELYPEPYLHGAKVRTESWGGDSIFYTSSARETDSFAHAHPDFLILWAAGNEGDRGAFTIGSPATGKNQLAVGAQHSSIESLALQQSDSTFVHVEAPGQEGLSMVGRWASFGSRAEVRAEVVAVDPPEACDAPTVSVAGKWALARRGTCTFTDKAARLQAAGAAGMVVQDSGAEGVVSMGGAAPGVSMPCLSVSRADGQAIRALGPGAVVSTAPGGAAADSWQQHLASFSAQGPTGDGRLKPEIVAPGNDIWSARPGNGAAGQCSGVPPARGASVVDMGGTSMASPVAAGGAAIARQYFLEGYYPSGRASPPDGFAPSGALLRAVMVTGTARLLGTVGGGAPLQRRIPNQQQGFGSLALVRALRLDPPADDGPAALMVRDEAGRWAAACLETGGVWSWGVRVRGAGAGGLKATLAWTDPPASLAAEVVLVNDLDLALAAPDGRHWPGNNWTGASAGREYHMWDRLNNHEQVWLEAPAAGEYRVLVRGHHVPAGPQCFALVVAGDFEADAQPPAEPPACPAAPGGPRCSGHGSCGTGAAATLCVCDDLWAGLDCGRAVALLDDGQSVSATVTSGGWDYYALDLGAHAGGWFRLTLMRTGGGGDPDMYVQTGGLPSATAVAFACECASAADTGPCACRELSCDSCDDTSGGGPTVAHSVASAAGARLRGMVYVGITGFCCEPAQYRLVAAVRPAGCDGQAGSGRVEGCDGVCGSAAREDVCGVCGGDGSSCAGCQAPLDGCGVCGGDGSTCAGCDGVPNSGKTVDVCGVCGGQGTTCAGCDGVPNSGKDLDVCGVCGGDGKSCVGCDGLVNSGATFDACGVCGGDGSSCAGCDGLAWSGKADDACGVCGGDGSSCAGCDGVANSGKTPDVCGVCGGDGGCVGCDEVAKSGKVVDVCGVCGGNGSSCTGCDGVPKSGKSGDACGVCGGDGSSCAGCDGVAKSGKVVDVCGVCGGNGSCVGCDGVPFSVKTNDTCGVCGGDGSSCAGCDGVPKSGKAFDLCGVCGGDGGSCANATQRVVEAEVVVMGLARADFDAQAQATFKDAVVHSLAAAAAGARLSVSLAQVLDVRRDAAAGAAAAAAAASGVRVVFRVAALAPPADDPLDMPAAVRAAVGGGGLARELTALLGVEVKVRMVRPPLVVPDAHTLRPDEPPAPGLPRVGGAWAAAAVVYLVCAAGLAGWLQARPARKRRWEVALGLWAAFGLVGLHRVYTRSPKVALLYFLTLGGAGLLWLMDLYWQRRFLFPQRSAEPAAGPASRAWRLRDSPFVGRGPRRAGPGRTRWRRMGEGEGEGEGDVEGAGGGEGEGEGGEGGEGVAVEDLQALPPLRSEAQCRDALPGERDADALLPAQR